MLETSHAAGLAPGSYGVSVQAFEVPIDIATGERRREPSKQLVPVRYTKVATSGLTYVVKAGVYRSTPNSSLMTAPVEH